MRRRIAILTGTRAEYGILTSVIEAVRRHSQLDYQLIVTGMHLSREYGYTIREIRKDRYKISATVEMLVTEEKDTGASMAKSLGRGIIGMARALEKLKPDILLVLGDRGEPLAGAIAAAHMNIPVAHMHGGEVSGTIDESIRHAITRFAHIHFPATRLSRKRLIRMGEQPWRIFLTGAAGVDAVRRKRLLSRDATARYFRFHANEPIVLAIQHPVTTEYLVAARNMKVFSDAVIGLGQQTVYVQSNADAGNRAMTAVMRRQMERMAAQPLIRAFKSLPHSIYLSAMKHAAVMIGNSSSGLIEAPAVGTPYVLVGTRQQGREQASTVVEAPYRVDAIRRQALRFLNGHRRPKSRNPYDPFGDARAGERIAEVLSKISIDLKLIQKRLAY